MGRESFSSVSRAIHTSSKRYSMTGKRVSCYATDDSLRSYNSKLAIVDLRTVNVNLDDIKHVQEEYFRKQAFWSTSSNFRKGMSSLLETKVFNNIILAVILMNTLMLVLSTWHSVEVAFDYYFTIIDGIFMAIYVLECTLKLYVYRLDYFKQGWDILDLVIVATSLGEMIAPLTVGSVSISGGGASIFRIIRVLRALRSLRVLRTIRFLENIQVILITCLHSFQSLGAIMALMTTFLVIFAVIGRGLFEHIDPKHFGGFWKASFTLIQLLTLDDWFEIFTGMSDLHGEFDIAAFFFLLFYIIIEYFVFLNLFIAVLVDNFQLTLGEKLVRKAKEKEKLAEIKRQMKEKKHVEEETESVDNLNALYKQMLLLGDEHTQSKKDEFNPDDEFENFMENSQDEEFDLNKWYYLLLSSIEKQSHVYYNLTSCHTKIIDMIVDNTDDVIDRR